ncbi:LOW QUALITY PROTEIN: Reverse transcriptase [Phytophthora palmivora]|uniref:Reverse transcriptase n=1 Tax=Phytophthora palmivora TaxID=4796 RepID=A0A2P4YE39_9STRA|nr:LOW QUALITY PROTEIN: Reverse transcriptase [Phytophthora palmivora]
MWLSGDRIPRIPEYVSATTDEISEVDINEQIAEPAVEPPEYVTQTAILPRPAKAIQKVEIAGDGGANLPSSKCTSNQGKVDSVNNNDLHIKIKANVGDPTMDEEVCIKERGTLFAEDVEDQMAVLPEVTATTEEVKIEDLQIGDAKTNTASCADYLETEAPSYRKGQCLTTSGEGSVVIIKKNGIDIRLCIDYRLVNSVTRLMVYPMPVINEFIDDLDKFLWYCSLDMASGFWVVTMTDRARSISAFITPFGLGIECLSDLTRSPDLPETPRQCTIWILEDQDRSDRKDVFETGEPDLERNESVLGRRSYIDDILVTGRSWDELCKKVEKRLDACDEWNLSISVTKSFWGRQKVDYLGHRVSAEGLETHPKDLSALQELPFPTNLRSMQSFLGSLNYYSRFIEDFAIYASVLYELREADFNEITRKVKSTGDDEGVVAEEDDRWTEARTAFTILKNKIVTAPILQHFDIDRQPVVVVYAIKWAISAALMQEHDGIYKPVNFTSHTLKPNEINYGMVDKEVLALLRILDICYTQLVTRSIKVLSRHSTLTWLLRTCGFWALEIVKCTRGEDEISGVITASITPRKEVGSILIWIAPSKQSRQMISTPPPTVEPDERLLVVSFDGSALISAASKYQLDLTVNEAEYHGLLLCLDLLSDMDSGRLIICGDSNLVIRQMRGEIECKAPGLTLLRQQALEHLRSWPNHEFLHMKRDWNQSADSLASAALRHESGVVIATEEERQGLMTLNRLEKLLIAKNYATTLQITAVTRSRKNCRPQMLQEEIMQRMRIERINRAQDEEKWIVDLKAYLRGDVQDLTSTEAKSCSKIVDRNETNESGLLFYFPPTKQSDEDRDLVAKLVMPETLQNDLMHHYHSSLKGGHQGIGRTYHKIRAHFHWRGLYQSVQRYVGQYIDCETGKGRPTIHGESPGNLQATYPFQIIGMDHIPSLPRSHKGNIEVLI